MRNESLGYNENLNEEMNVFNPREEEATEESHIADEKFTIRVQSVTLQSLPHTPAHTTVSQISLHYVWDYSEGHFSILVVHYALC
ncbi:hypothetical protein J6590_052614 [Homalodisca vitripennis]|nr:hypothetical protein J6590_052614 [Homalodisca vitripennis]